MNTELEYDESHEDYGVTNRFAYDPLPHPCDAYESQQDCPPSLGYGVLTPTSRLRAATRRMK